MKSDIIRTSVYLPRLLHEKAKKLKINVSALLNETLESEIYQDDPDFIQKKIKEIDVAYHKNRDFLLAKLRVAEEKQDKKKQLISQNDYQTEDKQAWMPKRIIPKENSEDG